MNDHAVPHDTRREGRTILAIALPLTTAYLAEMGMFITDMIFVGRLGSDELAAVGLAGDLFWVFLLVGMGVVSVVGVLVAQSLGANDTESLVDAADQGMVVATLVSLPLMVCVWFLGPALSYADQDPRVVELITGYSRVLVWGVLPALWFVVLRNYITALAHSAAIGWITVGAVGLNLVLNYALVFGKFGFPALGVVGAGIGTTTVNWIMFLTLVFYIRRSAQFEGRRPRIIPRALKMTTLREIARLGAPVGLTQILNAGMFSAAGILTGIISTSTLAAQQILYSVIYVALSLSGGFADAVRVRVAYGLGRNDVEAVRRSARLALTMTAIAALIAALVFWLIPGPLVGIFLDRDLEENREVLIIALSLGFAAGLFLLIDSVQMVLADAIRGLRDTRSPLFISFIGYWIVGLGVGAWLCFGLDLGAGGLWWGLVAGVALCAALLYWRLRTLIASGLPTQAP